jgi:hypothetical protein
MNTNVLASAAALSDHDLHARLIALAAGERAASVELVAHLAALDARPSVYAAEGYGSLFDYCTQALRLSEDAACNRIGAARACRRFPVILDHLASGAMTLTSVRMLGRHLTSENHEDVLARAKGRTREELEILVATLAPRPDARSLVRRLPVPAAPANVPLIVTSLPSLSVAPMAPSPAPVLPVPRPTVQPTAPERYRVQFTIGESTREKLRRLQALLRREIPDGDPGAIFDRAIGLLLDHVENRKLGMTANPRSGPSIRPETDEADIRTPPPDIRTPPPRSRYVPRAVKRAVYRRDGGQCAFASTGGRRCTARSFLEFHHDPAYAKGGVATVETISLRCWRHNQYEAELIFGPHELDRTDGFDRPGGVDPPEGPSPRP